MPRRGVVDRLACQASVASSAFRRNINLWSAAWATGLAEADFVQEIAIQGVVKSFDPHGGFGSLLAESDLHEIDLAPDALEGTIFRFLRQGQRVNFDLDENGLATRLRFGSEKDMLTPTECPPGS